MWLEANRKMQEFAYLDSKVTTHGTTRAAERIFIWGGKDKKGTVM